MSSLLYGVADCAVEPRLYPQVQRLEPGGARCLFQGDLHPEVKAVSPHLVTLTQGDPLTDAWRTQGWGQSWGVWLTSSAGLHAVWRRLRHFTQAVLPSGEGPLLFRFWDPRVLRVYLPLVEPAELPGWFEDVEAYIVAAEDGRGALRFTLAGGALNTESRAAI